MVRRQSQGTLSESSSNINERELQKENTRGGNDPKQSGKLPERKPRFSSRLSDGKRPASSEEHRGLRVPDGGGGERLQQRTGSRGRTDAQQPRARASGPLLLPGARGGLAPKARSEAGARPRTLKQAHKRDARGPALAGPAGGPHCEQVGFTLGLGQVTRHSDLRTRALVGLTSSGEFWPPRYKARGSRHMRPLCGKERGGLQERRAAPLAASREAGPQPLKRQTRDSAQHPTNSRQQGIPRGRQT